MKRQSISTHWGRYFAMLALGLILFLGSVAAVIQYLVSNRYDSIVQDAYDYHMLLQAQQALDRLVYRIELASMDASSVNATETRASLNDQLEIAWSRFSDLLDSENASRLRQLPGLPEFVAQVIEMLKNFQDASNTPRPDYLAYLEQTRHLASAFSHTFSSLPAHLLPIQQEQQKQTLRERYWYYSALGFSSFIVLLLYGIALREVLRLRQALEDTKE